MTTKLVLEKRKFDAFMRDFKKGKFGSMRLGQAFYNEMNLHKLSNQKQLNNLYAKDGDHAVNSIKTIFEFN